MPNSCQFRQNKTKQNMIRDSIRYLLIKNLEFHSHVQTIVHKLKIKTHQFIDLNK